MLTIIDISWPITNNTTGYKDRYKVQIHTHKSFDQDNVRESTLEISSHTGTHVDAPAHFLRDGVTIDSITLDRFIGNCTVLDLMNVRSHITDHDLQKCDSQIVLSTTVLFKTTNSLIAHNAPFCRDFVYLHESGARYLMSKGITGVGIDYLGIERDDPDHATHIALLSANILLVEGLRLAHVEPGNYRFICLPLSVIGTEAAPARMLLLKD